MKSIFSIFRESTESFGEQEKGEEVVLLLRKHPFVVLLPLSTFGFIGLVPILLFVVFYSYIINSSFFLAFLFLLSVCYLVLWLFAFYSLTIYTLNTVIVTDKRIIDNNQHGFFNRQVSELHLYRVQDITVHTQGVIKTVLRYGDVIVQTAASDKQFIFHQVPEPEKVKNIIMKTVASKHSGVRSF